LGPPHPFDCERISAAFLQGIFAVEKCQDMVISPAQAFCLSWAKIFSSFRMVMIISDAEDGQILKENFS
jgi:hypothetical protein